MQGHKPYQEKLFSTINLREMIPDNYLLVKIGKILDLSFIYKFTESLYCKDNGRQSMTLLYFLGCK